MKSLRNIPWGWALGTFAAGYFTCKLMANAAATAGTSAATPGGISSPTPSGGYAYGPAPTNVGQLMSPTGTLSQGSGAGGAITANASIPFGGGSTRGELNLSGFGFF